MSDQRRDRADWLLWLIGRMDGKETVKGSETVKITMPPNDLLLALAMRLERRRRATEYTCGPNSNAEHLEHMRNRILIASTDAQKEATK